MLKGSPLCAHSHRELAEVSVALPSTGKQPIYFVGCALLIFPLLTFFSCQWSKYMWDVTTCLMKGELHVGGSRDGHY